MSELRSVCVYCGSSGTVGRPFLDAAHRLGRLIGEAGLTLVYGGGGAGLMERVAAGAAAAGSTVVGIIPGHLREFEGSPGAGAELVVVETMHERKQAMAERSDGFAILPGGVGTLDELFEIVTWRQLGLHDKPIVLVNLDGYWDPLAAMLDRMVEARFLTPAARGLIAIVDRVDDAIPALRNSGSHARMLRRDLL
jgi:uncharacterized protein (TIGR00730 family)